MRYALCHDDCHHAVAAIAEPADRLARAETARLRIAGNVAPRFFIQRNEKQAPFQQFAAALGGADIGHGTNDL